jgi:hypothetical protein
MLEKAKAFRDWWDLTHGKDRPKGISHKHEELIYQSWSAGWNNALLKITPKCCTGECRQGKECPG